MNWTWLHRLLTPCPSHLQELRTLDELLGIHARARRCQQAWGPHLINSQQFMLRLAARCEQRRRVVVLGSGLLHDVPLEALARQFQEVWLVDLLHLLPVRWQVRRFPNARLISYDLTGVLAPLVQGVRTFGKRGQRFVLPAPHCEFLRESTDPLSKTQPGTFPGILPGTLPDSELRTVSSPAPRGENALDLVISLNMLSQLSIAPTEYLDPLKSPEGRHLYDARELQAYGQQILLSHLRWLQDLPCRRVALVTDEIRRTYRPDGSLNYIEHMLEALPLQLEGERWQWHIAPRGELESGLDFYHEVVAVSDVRTIDLPAQLPSHPAFRRPSL